MRTILTNCTVIDCTGRLPMVDMTAVIEGEEVSALCACPAARFA